MKQSVGDLTYLRDEYARHRRASHKSPKTIEADVSAIESLERFLGERGMPRTVSALTREHVESYMEDQLARWKPATAHQRYRHLKRFFAWLVAENEIPSSPMRNLGPPELPERKPDVMTTAAFDALVDTCDDTFTGRRDKAILWMLRQTGIRAAELMGLRLQDVDRDATLLIDKQHVHAPKVRVIGKGDRQRDVGFLGETDQALGRYLRRRAAHRHAGLEWLWIGERGRLSASGLRQMLEMRAEKAEVGHVHPHSFRHFMADEWLRSGRSETGLMAQAGWRSRAMLQRYANANAEDRARIEQLERM